jgi:tRNA (cytidine/uridine-2'-O-)-methyltransferase
MLHVVLYQPEIPHNTGAIGRLCLATGARLHLIKPLGFRIDDRQLKRAGLDYWQEVDVHVWDSLDDLRRAAPDAPWFLMTTKAGQTYWDATFTRECYLVFGPESRGLPESLLHEPGASCLRIPMQGTRSLNLATAVGIVLYEALRQTRVAG